MAWSNGFVTEKKRETKHAEFGYMVTKFISSDGRGPRDRFVKRTTHKMTLHQTDVSVRFVRWKCLNMLKTFNWTVGTDITRHRRIRSGFFSVTHPLALCDRAFSHVLLFFFPDKHCTRQAMNSLVSQLILLVPCILWPPNYVVRYREVERRSLYNETQVRLPWAEVKFGSVY